RPAAPVLFQSVTTSACVVAAQSVMTIAIAGTRKRVIGSPIAWRPRRVEGRRLCLPDLLAVELIALDRQRADALAHLVPDPLIAGIVDAAINTQESSTLAAITS